MRRFVPLAALAVLAAACTPASTVRPADPGTAAGYPYHSADDIVLAMEASVARVQSYRAESRLEADRGGRTTDLTASVRARLSDSLVAIIRGPLGIEGARALVTPDSFYAIDRLNGRFYFGGVDAAERYVPGAGERGRLARVLLGLETPVAGPDWSVRPTNGVYVLVSPGGGETWTVDPRFWRATSVTETSADGRRLSRTYADFGTVDGVVFPRRVVLASPSDTARLTLEHRVVTMNPDDLRLSFSPPADLDRVRLGG